MADLKVETILMWYWLWEFEYHCEFNAYSNNKKKQSSTIE